MFDARKSSLLQKWGYLSCLVVGGDLAVFEHYRHITLYHETPFYENWFYDLPIPILLPQFKILDIHKDIAHKSKTHAKLEQEFLQTPPIPTTCKER